LSGLAEAGGDHPGAENTSPLLGGVVSAATTFDLLYLATQTEAFLYLDQTKIMKSQETQNSADPGC